jgi:hypothetical protein
MKKFNLKKWITENKHGKTQTEQLGPRMKSPRPTGPSDPRSSKDIEFDNAQAMSRLTPDDKDKLEKIKQMMDKEKQKLEARADWTPPPMGMGGEEKEDEEQDEYDKGWYGESKLLDRIKEKPTVEERTAVLNYWLSKSPSRSQLPDIFDLDKENYKGNDPLILSYIEKMDQDIPYRILRQENAFFNGELIRMLNHPDDQEYIQMHKDTIVHNGVDPFSNKLTPQNHDVMADEAKADPDLAETKTLKEIAIKLGYLKEISGMEDVDNTNLEQIKSGINKVTGGGRQTASVSDKGNKIMILFKYVRSEFEERMWENILDYLTENMGYIISYESNNYEENYDKGEPAEAIPTIEINKTKKLDKPDEKDNTKVKNTGSKLRLNKATTTYGPSNPRPLYRESKK